MHRLEGQVGEERLRAGRLLVDVGPQAIHQQVRRVEPLGHRGRLAVLEPGRLGVVGHVGLRGPVVGAGRVERQGPIEAVAVGQGPLAVPQMPLAGHQGAVAFGLEPVGDGEHAGLDLQAVAALVLLGGRQDLFDRRHPGPVVVHAGQQHGPRGRAEGRGMVAGEHRPRLRQPVDVRRCGPSPPKAPKSIRAASSTRMSTMFGRRAAGACGTAVGAAAVCDSAAGAWPRAIRLARLKPARRRPMAWRMTSPDPSRRDCGTHSATSQRCASHPDWRSWRRGALR